MPLEGGKTIDLYIDELRRTVKLVQSSNAPEFGETATRLGEAVDSLERATRWLLAQKASDAALAGATPICDCLAIPLVAACWPKRRLPRLAPVTAIGRTVLARFFAENIAVQAGSLERSVTEGAGSIAGAQAVLAE